MTDSTLRRAPASRAVWAEQLSVVGLAFRREAVLAGVILVLGCLAIIAALRIPSLDVVLDGASVANLRLDPGEPPWTLFGVFVALLLPLLVWRGERPFGMTPIWSLPQDHRRHTFIKVAAGWVWLMAILGAALLCLVLTALAAGGGVGVDEVRFLITDPGSRATGVLGAADQVPWTTPWWEWVLPFTAATAAYLLVSALIVGTARPFHMAAALWVLVGMLAGIAEFWEVAWLTHGLDLLNWFVGGDPFTRGLRLPTGGVEGWTLLPTFAMWATSSLFWIGLGLAGVLGAAARPRDH